MEILTIALNTFWVVYQILASLWVVHQVSLCTLWVVYMNRPLLTMTHGMSLLPNHSAHYGLSTKSRFAPYGLSRGLFLRFELTVPIGHSPAKLSVPGEI